MSSLLKSRIIDHELCVYEYGRRNLQHYPIGMSVLYSAQYTHMYIGVLCTNLPQILCLLFCSTINTRILKHLAEAEKSTFHGELSFKRSEGTAGLTVATREYELITEAHAQLSIVRNCSRYSLRVCLGEGKQLAGGGGQQ
jgi:hypothetical protein